MSWHEVISLIIGGGLVSLGYSILRDWFIGRAQKQEFARKRQTLLQMLADDLAALKEAASAAGTRSTTDLMAAYESALWPSLRKDAVTYLEPELVRRLHLTYNAVYAHMNSPEGSDFRTRFLDALKTRDLVLALEDAISRLQQEMDP